MRIVLTGNRAIDRRIVDAAVFVDNAGQRIRDSRMAAQERLDATTRRVRRRLRSARTRLSSALRRIK